MKAMIMKWIRKLYYGRIKKVIIVSIITILSCFLIGEVVFRIIFPDNISIIYREFDENCKIYKAKANREGKYIKRNVKNGYFRINNEGWNSTRDYFAEKDHDILRVAAIGGCNTESMPVNVKDAYPNVIEKTLLSHGINCEVYAFGGAHTQLARALHLTRYVISKFHPDIIIIDGYPGGDILTTATRHKCYMSVDIDTNGVVKEVMPVSEVIIHREIQKILYHSKLIIILDRTYDISVRCLNIIRKIISRFKSKKYVPYADRPTKHDIALRETRYKRDYEIARRYLLEKFKKIQEQNNVKIVFTIGPWYFASYNYSIVDRQQKSEENRTFIKDLMEKHSLVYFDLTDTFTADYEVNGRKFDFLYNEHFNTYGCMVKGIAIADYLIENDFLIRNN